MVSEREQTAITVDDLMQFDEDRWIEIVDGQLVEADMSAAGYNHIIVIGNVYDTLRDFARKNKLGRVHPDGLTYVLHVSEKRVVRTRIPDVSFIRKDAIPDDFDRDRPFMGAPTLAVEVTSPSQTVEDMQDRVHDYLTYGTEEVWVIYAKTKEVYQYRHDDPGIVRVYRGDDAVDTQHLFPGLQLFAKDLFVISD